MLSTKYTSDDFFTLFIKREWKVILGKKISTLWLLVGMLCAVILAISFSNASMKYLSDKMNDPFIKWVDIKNSYGEGDFSGLEYALSDQDVQSRFDINGYQSDYYFSFMFFGAEENMIQYYQCRFFEDLKTDLVEAILSKDNVIDDSRISDLNSLSDETIGIVITQSALLKLGYNKAPAYIDLCHYSEGADSLGISLYSNVFARVPIPVLGVVKRLPSNVDIISSKYFFVQENNDATYPFNLGCNRIYSESLRYFIPDGVDKEAFMAFLEKTAAEISSVNAVIDEYSFYRPEIDSYVTGQYISLLGEDFQPLVPLEVSAIHDSVMAEWSDKGICRVYDYNFSPYELSEKTYLSVYFNKLNHVKEFEDFVSEYKVKIDMSQINSKDNFNAVSVMGNVLSWAIILFAIICITLFIVNLLKSYFQKIKRNIGTFKAFGVSNRRLTRIYVLIVALTLLAAIIISLIIAVIFQGGLSLCGILREGTYNYLSVFNLKTLISLVVIFASSVITVNVVIKEMLKQTPGDLIYDRN